MKRVLVELGDRINRNGDPGDPVDTIDTLGAIWIYPAQLHSI